MIYLFLLASGATAGAGFGSAQTSLVFERERVVDRSHDGMPHAEDRMPHREAQADDLGGFLGASHGTERGPFAHEIQHRVVVLVTHGSAADLVGALVRFQRPLLHKRGRRMSITVERSDGRECAAAVDRWNFN